MRAIAQVQHARRVILQAGNGMRANTRVQHPRRITLRAGNSMRVIAPAATHPRNIAVTLFTSSARIVVPPNQRVDQMSLEHAGEVEASIELVLVIKRFR
ncbi:hypothetical protein [Pendulispora albinea]|uniref:Uncharacterized protein n=1 Tax=Pendulispora albinea TaxID=2741071 RepID=A0ABZ2M0Y7_9BACT